MSMVNNTGKVWANEVITNRVTVSNNANSLRVSIKAPAFSMGNNFLSLCIAIGMLGECLLVFLMIKSTLNLALLIPGFILLGAVLVFVFVKLWLWHNFGEELINIKGNSCEMHRNYGLFRSDVSQLILNHNSELYTNRNDKWSWKEFRGKGIFRLATVDANLTDFGLNLNDQEFEMIVQPINDQLNKLKKQRERVQSLSVENTIEDAPNTPDVESEKEVQPPSLDNQTQGQHRAALNDYLDKAAGGEADGETSKSTIDKKKKA